MSRYIFSVSYTHKTTKERLTVTEYGLSYEQVSQQSNTNKVKNSWVIVGTFTLGTLEINQWEKIKVIITCSERPSPIVFYLKGW